MTASVDCPSLCLVNSQRQQYLFADDRGLAYGDGLFETMRFRIQHLPAWSLHWQRLMRGAEVLRLKLDQQVILEDLERALTWARQQHINDGIIKLIVTRGRGGRGYAPPDTEQATVILIVKPYQRTDATAANGLGVELRNCSYKLNHNSTLAGLKHLNRLEQVLAALSVTLSNGQQGLVFDKDDRIIETLDHNLFLVKEGRLFTADLGFCGVAGVLRRAILEIFGPKLDIPVIVSHLYEADLRAADEVFICNGVRGITPVCRWQDATWTVGPVTRQLIQHISQQWNKLYDC